MPTMSSLCHAEEEMSLAHFTLATRDVEKTAAFFEKTLGYARKPVPANSPIAVAWFDIGNGQEMHALQVDRFEASAFESEFGRHVAVLVPRREFAALKRRLVDAGAELIEPGRATPFERFFFREPVNGYVFEVVDEKRAPREAQAPLAIHFDQ
jgi:catechol 2,3-dioxygenase-like lactoylglutathione lyase family enzyme